MATRGTTIIEVLIYLALFSIVVGGLMVAAYGFIETLDRNQIKAVLQSEQDFIVAKIDWAIEGAQTITVPSPNTSGPKLRLIRYDGGPVLMERVGTDIVLNGLALNNSNVTVSNVTFIHYKYSGIDGPEKVEAGFIVTAMLPNGMAISQAATTTRYVHK